MEREEFNAFYNNIKPGDEFSIDVFALYERFGSYLSYSEIRYDDFEEDRKPTPDDYFELWADKYLLEDTSFMSNVCAVMDGETVRVVGKNEDNEIILSCPDAGEPGEEICILMTRDEFFTTAEKDIERQIEEKKCEATHELD